MSAVLPIFVVLCVAILVAAVVLGVAIVPAFAWTAVGVASEVARPLLSSRRIRETSTSRHEPPPVATTEVPGQRADSLESMLVPADAWE